MNTLRPHPVVITFVASRCKDACAVINARFFLSQKALQAHHSDARLVTITLDTDYDTPFVMSRLAQRFGTNPGVEALKVLESKDLAGHRLRQRLTGAALKD